MTKNERSQNLVKRAELTQQFYNMFSEGWTRESVLEYLKTYLGNDARTCLNVAWAAYESDKQYQDYEEERSKLTWRQPS